MWQGTAVLVVEIITPDDKTFAKPGFYTAHGVQELLVVDWRIRRIRCFAMQEGQTERNQREVLAMSTAELVAVIDWPPLDD